MKIQFKSFENLSKEELYETLALRSEVFVVEQECAYQDVDGIDKQAHHLLCFEQTELVAYLRIFIPVTSNENANIGRVLVKQTHRKKGLAKKMMKSAIEFIANHDDTIPIELSAQSYLIKFYENLGFTREGSEYLEDGIPHIKMVHRPEY